MTTTERNALIDRAAIVALSNNPDTLEDFEEYLVSRVSTGDLIAIRDGAIQTIGTRLIASLMWEWNYA